MKKFEANYSGSKIVVDCITGEISGKTYYAREWIKNNFEAKWNADKKVWVSTPEIIQKAVEYPCVKCYITYVYKDAEQVVEAKVEKTVVSTKIVGENDFGFIIETTYSDGSKSRSAQ